MSCAAYFEEFKAYCKDLWFFNLCLRLLSSTVQHAAVSRWWWCARRNDASALVHLLVLYWCFITVLRQLWSFFSHRIVNMWNSLPADVILSPTLNCFKGTIDRLWRSLRYSVFWLSTDDPAISGSDLISPKANNGLLHLAATWWWWWWWLWHRCGPLWFVVVRCGN